MKKVLSFTLVSLAVAALAAPAFAGQFGGSIRGDVGATGSQVPFTVVNDYSDRNEWDWDFTGRLFMYTSCAPCGTYIAGSWQGSTHTVTSVDATVATSTIAVRNEFSKAKLGMGLDLIKTNCFAFTMEFGGNYLNADLDTNLTIVARTPDVLVERGNTEGFGLYTSFKGEYKFPSSCFGNCFSIYGKAEVADIIGRQRYAFGTGADVAAAEAALVSYESHYNNIVEIDLETALVYAPCFKCWDNLNMTFALGVRTDSFVNLFVHSTDGGDDTTNAVATTGLNSLARPTVFLEVGIKV